MSSITALTNINPEDAAMLQDVQNMFSTMKEALATMGSTFNDLGTHTAQVATMGPALEASQHIAKLKKHMQVSEQKQDAGIEDVKKLLREVVQDQVVEHLRQQIQSQLAGVIDEMVEEQVQEELKLHMPEALQATLLEQKRQINEIRQALHNSEARRANSLLRSSNMHDPIHTLLTRDGKVSTSFPKDLTALFALDAPTSQALVLDYGLPNVGPSRERCLNAFMQFIGVAYQLVPAAPSRAPPQA